MNDIVKNLSIIMADTYALYLKTQNYHWHVTGPQFKSLHELFESEYQELAEAVDEVAERIRIIGFQAPASFKAFEQLTRIKEGNSSFDANQMLTDLAQDHRSLSKNINQAMLLAQEDQDEGTANLLANRIEAHEKACWMLNASRS